MTRILVATQNRGKLREFQNMLTELEVEWVSLDDVGLSGMEVAETGSTFAENAILKAQAYHQASGLLTLADDSGLVVDALNGAPGIYSARYGAPQVTTDVGRYEKVLAELQNIPDDQRTARFVCVVAIAAPGCKVITVEGVFEGRIAYAPRGSNGFGYDPIFVTVDGRTSAEYSPAEKNQVSHRGVALRKAYPLLVDILHAS